ncbi:hypothetical protein TVAG_448980 [Trichomonas vaginalis G3]|uniref:Uncharacterized protein n=1 Tax=Trichomonas vaginalis (strain ATCC PRA-98 / G3) TaxID=412133 RepID=A2GJK7_TRIV3|nr:galactokinase protein [Trichomonas vaginalis G3]EAX82662.1 hypothetical protein TVAG_448980 [Trichomonas vaginalis G3]KAI5531854.1 galactokinase protein [Trichomonas vaginalis G3]|eukprot:XP_001295592.1 hypothetical protein [Trichomonas vaginalis G3]
MEFLTVEFLGRQQKFIINCRAEGMTYSQTKLAWEEEYPDLGTLVSIHIKGTEALRASVHHLTLNIYKTSNVYFTTQTTTLT